MSTGNFSQAPVDVLAAALAKGYGGLHVEQGVPVLDRNLNLLGDLITATVQQIVHRHIGDGTAGSTDFAILSSGAVNDFTITAGAYLAGGMVVTLAAGTTYLTQPVPATAKPAPLPPLTTPVAELQNPRIDTVFLDVWVDEIDETTDPDLANPGDLGLRTSTRSKTQFVVRVAENAAAPPAAPTGHGYYPLAQLSRPTGATVPGSGTPANNSMVDLRQTGLSFALMARRMADIQSVLSPVVTAIAPSHVLPGQANPIVITGRNFDLGSVTVMLGDVAGIIDTALTTWTTLIVAVPSTAVPGQCPVTVRGVIGTATASQLLTIDTPPPPPAFATPASGLAQIVPAHAAPAATLTLNGSNFLGVNRVAFNVTPPVYAVLLGDLLSVTDSIIRVNVPAALSTLTVNSTMTLTVSVDGAPSMQGTSATLFTIISQPFPTPAFGDTNSQITTTPASNPVTQSHGNPVTLSGTNFGNSSATTTVRFLGTNTVTAAASDVVSVSPTAIVVKVPAALTVAAAPANKCKVVVIVQNISTSPSQDALIIV